MSVRVDRLDPLAQVVIDGLGDVPARVDDLLDASECQVVRVLGDEEVRVLPGQEVPALIVRRGYRVPERIRDGRDASVGIVHLARRVPSGRRGVPHPADCIILIQGLVPANVRRVHKELMGVVPVRHGVPAEVLEASEGAGSVIESVGGVATGPHGGVQVPVRGVGVPRRVAPRVRRAR